MDILATDGFWTMVQTIAVIITLVPIYRQMRTQTASHMVQTLETIHSRWNEEARLRARLKVCSDYLKNEQKFDGANEYIAEFIEELGVYIKMNAASKKVLWMLNLGILNTITAYFKMVSGTQERSVKKKP